jgi:hypothetical protein
LDSGDSPDVADALVGLAKSVLITGVLGVSFLLFSTAIAVCTVPVAYVVITSPAGGHLTGYSVVLVIVTEVTCLAIAIELCLVGATFFIKGTGNSLIKLGQALGKTGELWRLGEAGRALESLGDVVGKGVASFPRQFSNWLLMVVGAKSGKPKLLLVLVIASLLAAFPSIHDLIVKGPSSLLDREGIQTVRGAWAESLMIVRFTGASFLISLLSKAVLPK